MDRGAWWATVHRVAKSQTQLKRQSTQKRDESDRVRKKNWDKAHNLFCQNGISQSSWEKEFNQFQLETWQTGCYQCIRQYRLLQEKYHRSGGTNNRLILTVLEAGNPRSRHQQIQCLVRACFLIGDYQLLTVSSTSCKMDRELSWFSFIRALIPFMGAQHL